MDKTLTKGLALLEVLSQEEAPVGITELARALSLTKSNVHRLLGTLVACGYVETAGGKYSATLKLWQVGSPVLRRLEIKSVARPHLDQLAEATRETVHLSILDGDEVLYIDKIDSPQPVRAYSEIGGKAPAYCVATGKALLAFRAMDVPLPKLVPHSRATIVDPLRLRVELEAIRARGYAINKGEWRDSVHGAAAPIWGSGGAVIAAVGISGPADRLTSVALRKMIPLVTRAARDISTKMGATFTAAEPAWVL